MIPTNSELESYIQGLHEQIKEQRDRLDALIAAYSGTAGELSRADQAMHVRLSAVEYKTREMPGFMQAEDGEWKVVCADCGATADTLVADVVREHTSIVPVGFYCAKHAKQYEGRSLYMTGQHVTGAMMSICRAMDSA